MPSNGRTDRVDTECGKDSGDRRVAVIPEGPCMIPLFVLDPD
jgi:hypothetical protein